MSKEDIIKKWKEHGLFDDMENMTTSNIAELMESEASKLLKDEKVINGKCIHEYEPTPYQKYKDVRVLKCSVCGKIKKENTRIKKPKQR